MFLNGVITTPVLAQTIEDASPVVIEEVTSSSESSSSSEEKIEAIHEIENSSSSSEISKSSESSSSVSSEEEIIEGLQIQSSSSSESSESSQSSEFSEDVHVIVDLVLPGTSSESSASSEEEIEILASLISTPTVAVSSNTHPSFTVAKDAEIQSVEELEQRLVVTLTDTDGTTSTPEIDIAIEQDVYVVTVLPGTDFTPGLYNISAIIDGTRGATRQLQKLFRATEGDVEDIVVLSDTVQWGTVVFNTDRADYNIGDTANLKFALLSDYGNALCDADIVLTITDPDGNASEPNVAHPYACEATAGGLPVFTTAITFASAGDHVVSLTADTADGQRVLRQVISVTDEQSIIDVQRNNAVVSLAGTEQTMTITITPSHTFIGTISETVPYNLEIISSEPVADLSLDSVGDKRLTWNKQWDADTSYTLSYTYISPVEEKAFRLFGPIAGKGTVMGDTAIEVIDDSSSSDSSDVSSESSASSASSEKEIEAIEAIEDSSSSDSSEASSESSDSSEASSESSDSSEASSESSETVEIIEIEEVSSIWERIFSFIIPDAIAKSVDRDLRFTEPRQWQTVFVLDIVGEAAKDSGFAFVTEESAPLEQKTENILVLEIEGDHEVFALGSEPEFVILEPIVSTAEERTQEDVVAEEVDVIADILEIVIDTDSIELAIAEAIIADQGTQERIAAAVMEDSLNVTELSASILPVGARLRASTMNTVEDEIIDVLDEIQKLIAVEAQDIVGTVLEEADIEEVKQQMIAELVDGEIDDVVIENIVQSVLDSEIITVVAEVIAEDITVQDIVVEAVVSMQDAPVVKEADEPETIFEVVVTDPTGEIVEVQHYFESKSDGSTVLKLGTISGNKPGKYTVETHITNPLTGDTQTFTQDFTWGVLAFNTAKDIYLPGEVVDLALAVLDDKGDMVCDATLDLIVVSPSGTTTTLSTTDGSITVSSTCRIKKTGMITPDYSTMFRIDEPGVYVVEATAITPNGVRSLASEIIVEADPSFVIERTGATRLYPLGYSPMTITIEFFQDFSGSITEKLPLDFNPIGINVSGTLSIDSTEITWEGSWSEGQKVEFFYQFDAPDTSPEFYTLGPITMLTTDGTLYEEARVWQIANDFVSPIAGTVYSDYGITPLGAGIKVSYSINGAAIADSTLTDAGGQFVLSGSAVITGSILTLFIDDATQDGVTVIHAGSGSMTGAHIYQNRLIIRSESGAVAITNDSLNIADNSGDTDIAAVYTVDSNVLNVKEYMSLLVWSGSTFTPSGDVNVASGITIDGTWNAAGNWVTLSGAWLKSASGSFNHGTGTVALNGTGNLLSGSTVFWHLAKTGSVTQTLTLDYYSRQAVTGSLILRGSGNHILNIRSSKTGFSAPLILFGYSSMFSVLEHLDVKDIHSTGSTVNRAITLNCSKNCQDSGNNEGWTFTSYTIVGTAYSDEGVTPLASKTVAFGKSGGAATESVTTDAGGQFTLSGTTMTGGNVFTIYFNGGTETGAVVLLGSGSSMSGIDLYQNRLIVRSRSGSAVVTNSHLTIARANGDTDITRMISAASNSALTVGAQMELFIWTGSVFKPGGTITLDDIDINGTLNLGTNTLTASGSFDATGGNFSISGTTTFNSTTSTNTITMNGGTMSGAIFAGEKGTWTLQDATDFNGTVTISGGTLAQGNATLSIGEDFRIAAGASFTKSTNSSLFTLDGDLILDDEVTVNLGNLAISASPDNTVTLSDALQVDTLRIGTGDTLTLSGFNLFIGTGGLHLHGNLNAGNNGSAISLITVSGSWLQSGTGEFISGDSTVLFDGTAGSYEISSSGAFNNLVFSGTGGTWTASGDNMDVNGSFSLSAGTLTAPTALLLSGSFLNGASGTFTHNSGSVILDGNSQTVSGSTSFYNFTKYGTEPDTLTFAATAEQTFSGALVMTGASATSRVKLRSSLSGFAALLTLDSAGSQSISFLDVKDMDVSNGQVLTCSQCLDSGNNTGWFFTTATVVGTLYSDRGVTPLPSKLVSISYNGGVTTASYTTDAGGQFTLSGVAMTGGTIITLFIDNASEDAVTVTLGSGGSMTGINMYQDFFIVRSDSGSVAQTNNILTSAANLGGSGDTDLTNIFTLSSKNLTIPSGKNLLISEGDTYNPSGTVTSPTLSVGTGSTVTASGFTVDINGDMTVFGNYNQGHGNLTVSGSLRIKAAGSFTHATNASLVTFDGTSTFEDEGNNALGSVIIGSSENTTLTVSGSLQAYILTIGTGDTLITNGYDLLVGTGSLHIHGYLNAADSSPHTTRITLSGSWLASGTGGFIPGSSTVLFDGTSGVHEITASGSFYRMVFSGTGATWTATGTFLDINGGLTVSAGTFIAPDIITLSGSFLNGASGTFTHHSGSVVLNGLDQTLSGSTVFFKLSKTGSTAQTLTFAADAQQSISGSLILKGTSASNRLSLRSSNSGIAAKLYVDVGSKKEFAYLDVQDINASPGVVLTCTTECVNSGNNTGWNFDTIVGTAYSDEGVTPLASVTVAMSLNGGAVTDTAITDAGGQFTLSGATSLTGGTIITLYLDSGASSGVTISLGSGSSMTGMSIFGDRLIVRSVAGSTAITNLDIDHANDNGDASISAILSSATTSAIILAADVELLVWTGSTFAPGGTITTEDIDINGTLTMGTNALTASGSFDATGGNFSISGTTTFNSTSALNTITMNGGTMSGVIFAGEDGVWTLQDATDFNGTVTISGGTLAQGNTTLNIAGDLRIGLGAAFTKSSNSSLLTLDGDLFLEDEQTVNLGNVAISGAPDNTVTLSGALQVDTLRIGTGDTLVLSGYNLFIGTGGLHLHGHLDAADTNSISVITISGSWLQSGTGDFISGRSTVVFDGTSGSHQISSSGSFYNLVFSGTGGTWTASGDSMDVNGSFSLSAGTLTAPDTLNLSGSFLNGASGTFTHNSGAVIFDGNAQTISGSTAFYDFTKNGTSADTLTFASTTEQTVSGTLTVNGGGASNKMTLVASISGIAALLTVDDAGTELATYLNIKDSDASNGQELSCTDCTNNGGNTNWAFALSSIVGTLFSDEGITPLASKKVAISFNGGAVTDDHITDADGQFSLSGASLTGGTIITMFIQDEAQDGVTVMLSSGASMTGVHIYQDFLILRSESGSSAVTNTTLALADYLNGTPDTDVSNIYTISAGALTVLTGKSLLVWGNDSFSPGGAITVPDLSVGTGSTFTANGAVDINGVLTVYGTFVQGNSTLNISGNILISSGSTFTKSSNSSRFIFDGDLTFKDEVQSSLGHVQIGTSPDTTTLLSDMIVDTLTVGTGDILILSGQNLMIGTGGLYLHGLIDATDDRGSMSLITVSGSWLASGTGDFIAGGSTVLFDGTSGSHRISASGAFNNLVFSGTGGSWTASGTYLDIDGNFTLSAGTFTAPDIITLSGSFLNGASGTFNHNSGSFILDGPDQTLSGSTVFYNLSKTGSTAQTLTFAATTEQSISGALLLHGASSTTLLSLRSSIASILSLLSLDPAGTQSLQYLDVKDNSASGGQLLTCGSLCANSGNNPNWLLDRITGTAYSDEGTTPLTSTEIAISYNGGAVTDTAVTDAGGLFTLSGANMTGGTVLTLYLNGGTATGVTILLGSGSSMTGISIFKDRLIVRSLSGSVAITNASLAIADDNADTDITAILSNASASAITLAGSYELLVWTGSTFAPGGTITLDDIDINGTLTLGTNALTASGSFDATGGTYSISGTTTFNSTASNNTITMNSGTMSGVIFAGENGAWTLQDATDFNGTVTISGGTLIQGNTTLNIAGDLRVAAGAAFTKSSNSSLLTLDGNLIVEDEQTVDFGNLAISGAPDNTVTLSGALQAQTLTIGTGDTLILSGFNLFIGTGGLHLHGNLNAANNGSAISVITISGSWLASGTGDFISGLSTVLFDGTTGSHRITSSGAFNNVVFSGTGGTWSASGDTMDIDGNFTLSAGTFVAPTVMDLSGSFLHGANATFTHNSGSLNLDGRSQTISGSTAFYSFTKSPQAMDTLTFAATTLNTFSGTFALNGAANNLLSIRSSTSGVQARITLSPAVSQDISFLDVQDNNANGGVSPNCTSCTNSNNNNNWFFETSTIVGTVYSDEGVTAITSTEVAISLNGGAASDTDITDAGGQFILSGSTLTGGTLITLYLNSGTSTGVVIMLGSGSSMTGISIFGNRLIVRSESGSVVITNADLANADNNGDNAISTILTSASTSAITVAAGKELLVWTGTTFSPGGTITLDDIDINGTLTLGTNVLTASGSFDSTGGNFSISGTTTFNSTTSTNTITTNGNTFSGVVFSGANGAWTLIDALDINGTVTISAGTLRQGNTTMNIGGDLRVAAGAGFTKSSNSSLLTLDGDLIIEDEQSVNFGNLAISGAPDNTVTLSGSLQADALTIGTGDTLTLSGFNLFIGTGGLHLHGSLNAANNGSAVSLITVSGSWLASGTGNFIAGDSTVLFDGTAGSYEISSSGAFNNLVFSGTGGTWTASGDAMDVNGSFTLSAGTFTAPTTLNISGSFLNGASGTFTHNSGTVILDGQNQTVSGSTAFYSFTKTISSPETLTFAASTEQTFSGTLTLKGVNGANLLTLASSISTVDYLFTLDAAGSESLTQLDVARSDASNGQELTCINCIDNSNNTNWNFAFPAVVGTVYSDEGTTPVASAIVSLSSNGGSKLSSFTTDAGGQYTVSGAFMTGGTILTLYLESVSSGVIIVIGSGSAMTGISIFANRLILRNESGSYSMTNADIAIADNNGAGFITGILSSASTSAITVETGNELLVWTGTTFVPGGTITTHDMDINGVLNFQRNAITVKGSWDMTSGTLSGHTAITFAPKITTATITSGGRTFSGVTLNGSGTVTLSDAMDINGSLKVLSGTFVQGLFALNVSDDVRIASGAVFTKSANSSVFTFDGNLIFEDEVGTNLGVVQIGSSPETITLSGSLHTDKLTIGTGDTLVLSGHNLFVGTGGLYIHGLLDATDAGSNTSTITVSGSWLASGTGDFISGRSTVLFDGSAGSYNITASGAFYNIVFSGTGGTWNASGEAFDINGSFTLSAGTFTAPTTLNISGSFLRGNSGTFIHNSGSVILDGGDQTVSGSTVFYNFTKTSTEGVTLEFAVGTQQSFSGALTLKGIIKPMIVSSTSSTITGSLNMGSGTVTLTLLNIEDIDADPGATLICNNCVDAGNNRNITFVTPVITGTAYSDEGVTPIANAIVSLSYDGRSAGDSDLTDSGGMFTLSGVVMTGGTVLAVYLDGGTSSGLTILLGSGSAMTGVHIYANRLIVRNFSTSAAITNANLAIADNNGDTDITAILSSATGGNITVAAQNELFIWTGSVFTPGGTITTDDIDIDGTLTLNTNALTASGSFDAQGGSFSSSGTITLHSYNTSNTIFSNGSTFSGLTLAGGSGSWILRDALNVDGVFHFSGGTLTQSGLTMNIAGDFTLGANVTFVRSLQQARVTLDGSLLYKDSKDLSLGYVTIGGSNSATITLTSDLRADLLVIGTGDTLLLSGHNLNIGTGGLFIHGTLDASDNNSYDNSIITLSGAWAASGTGGFIAGTSTVVLEAGAASSGISVNQITASGAFYNLVISATGAVYTASGTFLDIDGNLTISAGSLTGSDIITLAGDWMVGSGSTFDHNSGTVILDGIYQTITGSTLFYNLVMTGASSARLTLAAHTQQTISGSLTLHGPNSSNRLEIRSSSTGSYARLLVASGATYSVQNLDVQDSDARNGQLLYCETGCQNGGNNRNWAFATIVGTLYSDEGITPIANKTIAITTNGGAVFDLAETDAGGQFTLSGAPLTGGTILTLFVQDETQDAMTIFISDGTSATGVDLYQNRLILRSVSGSSIITNSDLIIADNNGGTFDDDITNILSSATAATGITVPEAKELLIWTGSIFTPSGAFTVHDIQIDGRLNISSGTGTVSGSWDGSNGIFSPGSGTLVFNAKSIETINTNNMELNNIHFTTTGSWTPAHDLDINGNIRILSGTFVAPRTITLSGSWTLGSGAVFTFGTGTVRLDGNRQTISGSTTFYNLVKTADEREYVTFSSNHLFTISGSLSMSGQSVLETITIRSTIDGAAHRLHVDAEGRDDMLYIDVKDSDASQGQAINCPVGCTDSGNNTNWLISTTGNSGPSGGGGGSTGAGGGGGGPTVEIRSTKHACLTFGRSLTSPFQDIEGHPAEHAIRQLQKARIGNANIALLRGRLYQQRGQHRRLYLPDEPITRAEMVELVLLANCVPIVHDPQDLNFAFIDVSSSTRQGGVDDVFKRKLIYTAVDLGLIDGYKDNNFRPDEPISKADAMRLLVLGSELPPLSTTPIQTFSDVPVKAWYAAFVERAVADGLIGTFSRLFMPLSTFSRGDAAFAVHQLIQNSGQKELITEDTGNPLLDEIAAEPSELQDAFDDPKDCLLFGEPPTPAFSDIADHWGSADIARLARIRLANGRRPLTSGYLVERGGRMIRQFGPNRDITRFEILKLALLSNCIPLISEIESAKVTFTDVRKKTRGNEDPEIWQKRAIIYTAASLGLIRGYDDGSFRADQPVTRAEALKIITLAANLPTLDNDGVQVFDDVPVYAWYAAYVNQAVGFGLVSGYSDSTFRPGNNITRAEVAKIINTILTSTEYVTTAIAQQKLRRAAVNAKDPFTSADVPAEPPASYLKYLENIPKPINPKTDLFTNTDNVQELQRNQRAVVRQTQNRDERLKLIEEREAAEALEAIKTEESIEDYIPEEVVQVDIEDCLIDADPLEPSFSDTETHWVGSIVKKLSSTHTAVSATPIVRGHLQGGKRLFYPEQSMTRYEFLTTVMKSRCYSLLSDLRHVHADFQDVPKARIQGESEAETIKRRVIYTAAHLKIAGGNGDATFRPDQPISRVEALAILLRASDIAPIHQSLIKTTNAFEDVPTYQWYYPYVYTAVYEGIVGGYRDGRFRPAKHLTRAEGAKLVHSLMHFNTEPPQQLISAAPEEIVEEEAGEDLLQKKRSIKPTEEEIELQKLAALLSQVTTKEEFEETVANIKRQQEVDADIINDCMFLGPNPQPAFNDIQGHWAEEKIGFLGRLRRRTSSRPLIQGYTTTIDGEPARIFSPDRPISRYEVLKLVLMSSCTALEKDIDSVPISFRDVPKDTFLTGDAALKRRIIYTAANMGIVRGYSDNFFKPDEPMTRAEALKVVILISGLPPLEDAPSEQYSDVPPSAWFTPYIERAAYDGIVSGYSDGTFKPGKAMTRAEFGKMLYMLLY